MTKKLPAFLKKSSGGASKSAPSSHPAKVLKSGSATAAQKAKAGRALRNSGKK